ncbi:hypothetical protein KAR91_33865 [Candidatus Pacearchaeota archaeon]|nr:hypothetical protein [Candidatus Pacearchaeota archaeon]
MARKKEWFKWTIEIQAHRDVVEDGLELTDDRARQMVEEGFPLCMGHDFKIKVVKRPDQREIRKAQGYTA